MQFINSNFEEYIESLYIVKVDKIAGLSDINAEIKRF